ncbi:hypothetical protein PRK78_000166 [Emydomyces testavorans]|uniref:SHSP domain-containing protein n=1 Tax=Emydomyces testavorans TaxID=2070801 RepID=A0AAF0DB73_9EURO|nr:hypothetical protein PRK78_000166 [Emydomyces testavorans]
MASFHYLNYAPNGLWDYLAVLGEQHGWHHPGHPPPYSSRDNLNGPSTSSQRNNTEQTFAPQPEARASESAEEGTETAQEQRENGARNHDHEGGSSPTSPHCHRGRRCHTRRGGCGSAGNRRGRSGFRPHHHAHHPWWAGPGFTSPEKRERPGTEAKFDLNDFLQSLGSQLGIDLQDILGQAAGNSDVDFVPRVDVFDLPDKFLVHASLPGAQKADISVDYDTETTTLSLAGVVRRPGINETLSDALIVDGRAREVGVFEKKVHLGTQNAPAHIEVGSITATLIDGILRVSLPKIPRTEPIRRKVSVEQVKEDTPAETKGKEKANESDSNAMQVDSETEAGSLHEEVSRSPHARDVEEEEKDYVNVDVD